MNRIIRVTLGLAGVQLKEFDLLPTWLLLPTLIVLGVEIVLTINWLLDEETVYL